MTARKSGKQKSTIMYLGISNKPPSVKPRPNFDNEIFENIKIPRETRILAAAGEKILTFQTLCKLDL